MSTSLHTKVRAINFTSLLYRGDGVGEMIDEVAKNYHGLLVSFTGCTMVILLQGLIWAPSIRMASLSWTVQILGMFWNGT